MALSGRAGDAVEELLAVAGRTGAQLLARLTRRALTRHLQHGTQALHGQQFFSAAERQELADLLASVQGTAGMLARALVRDYQQRLKVANGEAPAPVQEAIGDGPLDFSHLFRDLTTTEIPLLTPTDAVRYFADLVPTLGIDPLRYGEDMRRQAFTLAVATDQQLLTTVQGALAGVLQSGKVATGQRLIDAVLDQAGVTPRNPQYAEMVLRTNLMDAYNQQATQELQDPDVIETFPVWQYSAIVDSRSRPEHAARDGKYWPSSVPFVRVRGLSIEDAANCRCTFIAISKWQWAKLQAQGAKLEMAA